VRHHDAPNRRIWCFICVRQYAGDLRTPFVFLTAKSENSDIKKGIDLGACDYIVKPFENEELLRVVKEKLQKNKSPDKKIENFIL
jgi:DNA-binding response OmpR family regulator